MAARCVGCETRPSLRPDFDGLQGKRQEAVQRRVLEYPANDPWNRYKYEGGEHAFLFGASSDLPRLRNYFAKQAADSQWLRHTDLERWASLRGPVPGRENVRKG